MLETIEQRITDSRRLQAGLDLLLVAERIERAAFRAAGIGFNRANIRYITSVTTTEDAQKGLSLATWREWKPGDHPDDKRRYIGITNPIGSQESYCVDDHGRTYDDSGSRWQETFKDTENLKTATELLAVLWESDKVIAIHIPPLKLPASV